MIILKGRIFAALRALLSDPSKARTIFFPRRHAGVIIDQDTALTTSAYFRAIAYISGQIAGLPWDVIRETEDRTQKLPRHPVWRLLRTRASEELGPFTWRETLIAWALSWGNGYAEIEWDVAGRPIGLGPISPDRVLPRRGYMDGAVFVPDAEGEIIYQISNYGRGSSYLPADDVFHLHGLGFDGLVGYSVLTMAARSLGITIAAEGFAEDFFTNGAVTTGVLTHPGKLKDESYQRLKKDVEDKAKSGDKWKPMVLEEGMKWETISVPLKDAQMLETRQFQVGDVARWFGLPPHKLADLSRATFSNIESQSREVVNDCFMPWIHRLEEEANYKLFSGREQGIHTKLNTRGLLRGDDQARGAFYMIMRNIGVYSTNDIRRLEDMDPVGEEGDELLVQLNQTTLKRLAAGETAQPAESLPAAPDTEQVQQSYLMLVEDGFRRILKRESNRFDQSSHKLRDKSGFQEWLSDLCDQQREYMRSTLSPVLTSMVMLCLPFQAAQAVAGLQLILDAATANHLERTRRELESMKSGKNSDFDVETRAKQEAKALIESIFASFFGKGQACLPQ